MPRERWPELALAVGSDARPLFSQDGSCFEESEVCTNGASCCITTPLLYCQKEWAGAATGACTTVRCRAAPRCGTAQRAALPPCMRTPTALPPFRPAVCGVCTVWLQGRGQLLRRQVPTEPAKGPGGHLPRGARAAPLLSLLPLAPLALPALRELPWPGWGVAPDCQPSAPPPSAACLLQCISITKHGCTDETDCCTGKGCQREIAGESAGTCVAVRVLAVLCGLPAGGGPWRLLPGYSSQRLNGLAPRPIRTQCVELDHAGCLNTTTCCNGALCQRNFAPDRTGYCRTVRGGATGLGRA